MGGADADLTVGDSLIDVKRLIPVIGQRFTLADAPAAHIALQSRETTGKTVLRP